jgi:hypothetical protein
MPHLEPGQAHTTGVTALPDTTPILAKYLDQLLNGETGDSRFVRVRASKEFYVFVTETVLPASRGIMEERTDQKRSDGKTVPAENDKLSNKQSTQCAPFRRRLNPKKGEMIVRSLVISLAVAGAFTSCAVSQPESVTTEHKGKLLIVHHRRRTNNGLVDRIDAVRPNGVVTQAEVHVYDIGRLPHGGYGVDEAHRYYRIVQSPRPNLMLPRGARSSGPRTVYTPPNYVPPPQDQRINDAVAQAKAAKEKLEAAAKQVQERLKEDNALRGQLQAQIDENQRLQDQINAGFQHAPAPGASQSDPSDRCSESSAICGRSIVAVGQHARWAVINRQTQRLSNESPRTNITLTSEDTR